VIGGARWDRVLRYPFPITLLVLSRGDRLFRAGLLKDLQSLGLGEILWVEGPEPSADLETLGHDFPQVRFLLMKAPSTVGELINIGVEESHAPLVMALWSDTKLSTFSSSLLAPLEKAAAVCTIPMARNAKGELIPSWQSPFWKRRKLSLSFHVPRLDGESVLFPFDYCGVYHKEKYLQSGGFDPGISNPYWQKLDFGFRCFLWGDRLCGSTGISVSYTGTPPEEDTTPDQGYKLFWLKNLAVRKRREMGVIPARRVLDYMAHSDTGPLYAIKEFRAVRGWVRTHRFRFRRDPRELVERWENA
jgi:hypothetical protein